MRPQEFCYWLQGFFELSETNKLTEKQVESIKNHLNLVFFHEIDQSYGLNSEKMKVAQQIHDGKSSLSGPPKMIEEHNGPWMPGVPTPPIGVIETHGPVKYSKTEAGTIDKIYQNNPDGNLKVYRC